MDSVLDKVADAVDKAEPAVEKAVRSALGDKAGDAVHTAGEKLKDALHDDVSFDRLGRSPLPSEGSPSMCRCTGQSFRRWEVVREVGEGERLLASVSAGACEVSARRVPKKKKKRLSSHPSVFSLSPLDSNPAHRRNAPRLPMWLVKLRPRSRSSSERPRSRLMID